jgi:hypothetical protein
MPTIQCLVAWDGERVREVFVDTRAAFSYANDTNCPLYRGTIKLGDLKFKPTGLGMSRRRAKYKKGRRS